MTSGYTFFSKNISQEVKLSDVIDEVTTVLCARCNCFADVQNAEFRNCQRYDQDFVIFCGQLFAPLKTSAEDLLFILGNWVAEGPTIKITDANINSNCQPSEAYADACVQPAKITTSHSTPTVIPRPTTTTTTNGIYSCLNNISNSVRPTTTTTTNIIYSCPTNITSVVVFVPQITSTKEGVPLYAIPLTALVCFFFGVLLTCTLGGPLGYIMLKKRLEHLG